MSSHNALRFEVIYKDFRDVIIRFRRLNKSQQHGEMCWNWQVSQILSVSKDDYSSRPFGQGWIELVFRNVCVIFVKDMKKERFRNTTRNVPNEQKIKLYSWFPRM